MSDLIVSTLTQGLIYALLSYGVYYLFCAGLFQT